LEFSQLGLAASRPARSRIPGALDIEFPKAIGPKYLIRLLDIANKAATGAAAGDLTLKALQKKRRGQAATLIGDASAARRI
jgi:hypothetical protein